MSWRRFFVLFLVCAVLGCGKKEDPRAKSVDATKPFLTFISQYKRQQKSLTPQDGDGYVKGKLVVLREPGHGDGNYIAGDMFVVTEVQGLLPADLVAAKPEEVGTVAHLHCKDEVYGSYGDGTVAYLWNCAAAVVDLEAGLRVGLRTFKGSPPPQSVNAGGIKTMHGDRPYPDIAAWLSGLPRR